MAATGMQINSTAIPNPMDERGSYHFEPPAVIGKNGQGLAVTAGDAADRIYGIGGAIVGRLYAGFTDAANNLAWGKPILDSLAASVAPQVYDMLAEELTP